MIEDRAAPSEIALSRMSLDLTDDELIFDLGNGFVAVRRQVIIWAIVDPDICRHMASPGHNELMTGPVGYCVWNTFNQYTTGSPLLTWLNLNPGMDK